MQFENWCIQFQNLAQELIKTIEPYVKNNSLQIDSETIQNLLTIFNEMPANNLENFRENLLKQYLDLFGDARSIGQGDNNWMNVDFYLFGNEKSFIQGRCDNTWIHADLYKFQLDINLAYVTCSSFQKFVSNEANAGKLIATLSSMHSYFHPAPTKGVTGTLVDHVENWRQNIAAFRSCLSS